MTVIRFSLQNHILQVHPNPISTVTHTPNVYTAPNHAHTLPSWCPDVHIEMKKRNFYTQMRSKQTNVAVKLLPFFLVFLQLGKIIMKNEEKLKNIYLNEWKMKWKIIIIKTVYVRKIKNNRIEGYLDILIWKNWRKKKPNKMTKTFHEVVVGVEV